MFVPVVLKVYFLLAKKLKQKAAEVDKMFAVMTGRPKDLSRNNNPKSMAVFALPTSAKRSLVELFFCATWMIFLDKIERTVFGFGKDACDVLTNHAK